MESASGSQPEPPPSPVSSQLTTMSASLRVFGAQFPTATKFSTSMTVGEPLTSPANWTVAFAPAVALTWTP